MLIVHNHPALVLSSMPRLQLVIAGVQRVLAWSREKRTRHPIMLIILRQIRATWVPRGHSYEAIMHWVAYCVCFFGLGELVILSAVAYNTAIHTSCP